MKDAWYDFFVRKNEWIRREYERYVIEHIEEHDKLRFLHWLVLLRLNWHYRILRKKTPLLYENRDAGKVGNGGQKIGNAGQKRQKGSGREKLPYLKGAESRSTRWTPPHDMVRLLKDYDVVSFDIFDTLIFRPLDLPRHLFWFVGNELDMLNFVNVRTQAENTVRDEKEQREGHREVTIREIYEQIQKETGLDPERGIAAEIETERKLCQANPYMKYVFDTLLALGTRIFLVSDMYLPKEFVEQLLEKCGYAGYEQLLVSCDCQCSKRDGRLFQLLKDYAQGARADAPRIVHVGDNPETDIGMAQKMGLETFHYENTTVKGRPYRTDEIPGMVGSAYRGIVNNHLHNGYRRYDAYYEFGFLYGGLFHYGFAQHIHRFAAEHGMEKILFVARDGYIMKQIYDGCFTDIPSGYLLCSRISNLKMAAYCNRRAYLKEYVYRWVQEKMEISLGEVLENMELGKMIPELTSYVDPKERISEENTPALLRFLDDHWSQIRKIYEETIRVAGKYYGQYFAGAKKVLVVDIGWRGQAVLALRSLERDYWHFGCEIIGMLAASAPTHECQGQLQAGILNTYLFSPIDNISCFRFHSKISINNILLELFAGAPMPSFAGFREGDPGHGDDREENCKDGGEADSREAGTSYELIFDVPEPANYETIAKIHQGICDFAELYRRAFADYPYMNRISGYDAYMPIRHIFKDYSFIKRFFGNYEFQDTVGGTAGKNSRTMRDIFRKFRL